MEDLNRALDDIRAMRSQMARGAEFRGYGPATVAATGVLAVAAAVGQQRLLPAPGGNVAAWIGIWVCVAVVAVGLIGVEMVRRARVAHGGLADEMIQAAALRLLPAAVAGALLTVVLWRDAPDCLWMLPGLWQIVLSLGVFSACEGLPGGMRLVAFWYLGTGLCCLGFCSGSLAFSPWAMGVPFGAGGAMAAVLLARAGGEHG